MKKEELIRRQFQNILDKLVESKIQPTATAIILAEQPMIMLFEELMCEINKLQKENAELKRQLKTEIYARDMVVSLNSNLKQENEKVKKDYIRKDNIRKFIKEELPDDEIMKCCGMFDSNGVYLRKKLEEILEEK